MPYKLRKHRGQELYYVVKKESGEKMMKTPIPRDEAIKMMRALYANEGVKFYTPALPGTKKNKARKWESEEAKMAFMQKMRDARKKKSNPQLESHEPSS